MGSEKIFMFGEPGCGCGGGSKADLTAILPALMNNNKGIDPGILAAGRGSITLHFKRKHLAIK